jgi:hypothetical protein
LYREESDYEKETVKKLLYKLTESSVNIFAVHSADLFTEAQNVPVGRQSRNPIQRKRGSFQMDVSAKAKELWTVHDTENDVVDDEDEEENVNKPSDIKTSRSATAGLVPFLQYIKIEHTKRAIPDRLNIVTLPQARNGRLQRAVGEQFPRRLLLARERSKCESGAGQVFTEVATCREVQSKASDVILPESEETFRKLSLFVRQFLTQLRQGKHQLFEPTPGQLAGTNKQSAPADHHQENPISKKRRAIGNSTTGVRAETPTGPALDDDNGGATRKMRHAVGNVTTNEHAATSTQAHLQDNEETTNPGRATLKGSSIAPDRENLK